MFSSLFPWEFKANHPHLLEEGKKGLYAFSCYDAYLERMFLSLIPKHFLDEGAWKVLSGPEVTLSWIENNLATMDFFSNSQSYKVLNAEDMPKKVKEYLLRDDLDVGDRYFLLTFQKEDSFFDKIKKKHPTLKVKEPRFWEIGKLLKFMCEQMGLKLNYEAQNAIIDLVPNEPGEFILALKKLSQCGRPLNTLKGADIRSLLSQERLDQFELANFWAEKSHKKFYKSLLNLDDDFDGLFLFFRFLQGHIIKVLDPTYIHAKSRPSKYDQQVEASSRLWNKAELRDELKFFGECEILAKSKSKELTTQLRLKLIESYK